MNLEHSFSTGVPEITEILETEIIFGKLRPNQELTEDILMNRFNAKRHIVRSAIQVLISKRLVVKPRAKTARVKDFSLKEVGEIYYMRAILQREAALTMPLPAGKEAMESVRQAYAMHAEAVYSSLDQYLIHRLNDVFHDRLFALCQNTELCKAIKYYTEASNPIRSYGIVDATWLEQAVAEHLAMIEAVEAVDRDALIRQVVAHMQPTRLRWESMRVQTSTS